LGGAGGCRTGPPAEEETIVPVVLDRRGAGLGRARDQGRRRLIRLHSEGNFVIGTGGFVAGLDLSFKHIRASFSAQRISLIFC